MGSGLFEMAARVTSAQRSVGEDNGSYLTRWILVALLFGANTLQWRGGRRLSVSDLLVFKQCRQIGHAV